MEPTLDFLRLQRQQAQWAISDGNEKEVKIELVKMGDKAKRGVAISKSEDARREKNLTITQCSTP